MRGIDVSRWQAELDIGAAAEAGCGFVILKVTEGAAIKDPMAPVHYTRAGRAGVPTGGYCYSHALTSEQARLEAAYLLEAIGGFPMPLGLYLDLEEPEQLALSREKLLEIVRAFCAEVRGAGYLPGVYGSEYNLWAKISPGDLPEDVLIWTAHYGRAPDMPCDLWQSTDQGRLPGYDGPVDLDEVRSERFRRLVIGGGSGGTLEELCDLTQRQAEIIKKQAAENARLRRLLDEKEETCI